MRSVRKVISTFPVLIGSGADKNNIKNLLKYADGVIVSTSLKEGDNDNEEVNVKSWKKRIDGKEVKELVELISEDKK